MEHVKIAAEPKRIDPSALRVGDVLCLVERTWSVRGNDYEAEAVHVVSIGRKWIHLSRCAGGQASYRANRKTLEVDYEVGSQPELFASMADWELERALDGQWNAIQNAIRDRHKRPSAGVIAALAAAVAAMSDS